MHRTTSETYRLALTTWLDFALHSFCYTSKIIKNYVYKYVQNVILNV